MYKKIIDILSKFENFSLLLIRLILAYGFYKPAMMKINNIDSIAEWFGSMNYPLPALNAYLAAGTEFLGFVLLTVGLFTRFISIPLMFVMIVAVFTVHFPNGWEASNNGYEIPVYYFVMLLLLMAKGSGKFSIEYLFKKFRNK